MGANSEADPHQDGATPQGNVDQSEVECPRDDKEAAATSVTDRPSSAANRGSTSSSSATRTSFTRMTRQSRERPPSAHEKSMREKEADRIREEVRETRRRYGMPVVLWCMLPHQRMRRNYSPYESTQTTDIWRLNAHYDSLFSLLRSHVTHVELASVACHLLWKIPIQLVDRFQNIFEHVFKVESSTSSGNAKDWL